MSYLVGEAYQTAKWVTKVTGRRLTVSNTNTIDLARSRRLTYEIISWLFVKVMAGSPSRMKKGGSGEVNGSNT